MACKVYVVKLAEPEPIEGTKLFNVRFNGCSTVVTKEIEEGQTGLLFTPDSVITPLAMETLELDLPYIVGGRVRPLRLVKGTVYSDSLFIPLSREVIVKLRSLKGDLVADDVTKAVDEFNNTGYSAEVQEGNVWKTYIPAGILAARAQGKHGSNSPTRPRAFSTFPMHVSTEQFKFNIERIEELIKQGWEFEVSKKYHGTSGRTAFSMQPYTLPWYQRWLNKIGFNFPTERLQYAYGSRRVILGQRLPDKVYNSKTDYRQRVSAILETSNLMREGDVVYYELVGWTDKGSPIQPPINGKHYNYFTPDKRVSGVIYRWSSGGRDLTLSEIEHKIALHMDSYGFVFGFFPPVKYYAPTLDYVKGLFDEIEEGNVDGTNRCVEEGLVIRMHKDGKSEYYKWKTPSFYLGESTAYETVTTMTEEELN